jgi:hypothetical protein
MIKDINGRLFAASNKTLLQENEMSNIVLIISGHLIYSKVWKS